MVGLINESVVINQTELDLCWARLDNRIPASPRLPQPLLKTVWQIRKVIRLSSNSRNPGQKSVIFVSTGYKNNPGRQIYKFLSSFDLEKMNFQKKCVFAGNDFLWENITKFFWWKNLIAYNWQIPTTSFYFLPLQISKYQNDYLI